MEEYDLKYSVFMPSNKPKACVFIVHGMEEHRKRYDDFANYLKDNDIGVITYDLPGHGETTLDPEERGWFGEKFGWRTLVLSAVEIAQRTRKTFPGVPMYYFGHSMGTIIGRCFLQRFDTMIDGMILSGAPAIQDIAALGQLLAHKTNRKGKHGKSRRLDYMVTGMFNNGIEDPKTPVDWLSYNEENVKAYMEDPNCGFPFTIQGYYDLFTGLKWMATKEKYRMGNPNCPIYFFAGEEDPCIAGIKGFERSQNFLKEVGYKEVTSKLYPKMRHETLHEADYLHVYEDVLIWLEEHLS